MGRDDHGGDVMEQFMQPGWKLIRDNPESPYTQETQWVISFEIIHTETWVRTATDQHRRLKSLLTLGWKLVPT
jgi:hypothetical protein